MKQQITLRQFEECPRPRKFTDWMIKRNYGLLPNIGQMIEFLNDNDSFSGGHIDGQFNTVLGNPELYNETGFAIGYTGELCDQLWKNIKEVLNK